MFDDQQRDLVVDVSFSLSVISPKLVTHKSLCSL